MGFSLVRTVKARSKEELERVTNEIYSEMTAMVAAGKPNKKKAWPRTGLALGAINRYVLGEHKRFVGSIGKSEGTKHLYYLNEGNGGSGRIITAGGKAMGKYPEGIPGLGWRRSVHGYKGIDFVGKIAARHGG